MTCSYSLGILNCLCHSPVNFNKASMESFFACAHFCPVYGEVTLQCQNFTFMNGSDDGELTGQSHEILYANHLLCIIFIFYSLTPLSNMYCVLTAFWCWLLHYLPSLHILPIVGGCIYCISCVHSADYCIWFPFLHSQATCWHVFLFFHCILLTCCFSCRGYKYSNQ